LGVAFEVCPADVEELGEGDPAEVAVENALRKARAVTGADAGWSGPEIVLGVDTLVALNGSIYGKPADEQDARWTLASLGGAVHTVYSGVALIGRSDLGLDGERATAAGAGARSSEPLGMADEAGGWERTAVAATEVAFRELDKRLIDWYVATGEWRGRAGGYAIQGAGAALVRWVRGDYENVVGLPLATLLDLCPGLVFPCK
jgi:septum formation protein